MDYRRPPVPAAVEVGAVTLAIHDHVIGVVDGQPIIEQRLICRQATREEIVLMRRKLSPLSETEATNQ